MDFVRYLERGKLSVSLLERPNTPLPVRANLSGTDLDAYVNYASLLLSEEPQPQGRGNISKAKLKGIFAGNNMFANSEETDVVRANSCVSEAIDAWDSGECFSDFYSRKLKGFLSEITDGETQRLVRDSLHEHVRRTVAHAYSVEAYQDALLGSYVSLRELHNAIPGEIHDAEGPYSKLSPEIALGFALMDISDYAKNPLGKDGPLFERAKSLTPEFVQEAGKLGKIARKLHGLAPHHAFSRRNFVNATGRLISIYLWACDVYARIGEDTPYKEGATDVQNSFKGNSYERKVFNLFCRELSTLPKPRIHNSSAPLERLLSLEPSDSSEKDSSKTPLEMRSARYGRLVSSAENCLERLSHENYFMPGCLS